MLKDEILSLKEHQLADVYSLTIIAYEIITEKEPFQELTLSELQVKVGFEDHRPVMFNFQRPLAALLQQGWHKVSTQRPFMKQFQTEWNKIGAFFIR